MSLEKCSHASTHLELSMHGCNFTNIIYSINDINITLRILKKSTYRKVHLGNTNK